VKEWKSVVFLSVALGMLIYAVPRLDMGEGASLPTVFGIVWMLFALVVIAAHLHQLLGVDEETKAELARVKLQARRDREQLVRRGVRMLQTRK
jgi:hypothetical protein